MFTRNAETLREIFGLESSGGGTSKRDLFAKSVDRTDVHEVFRFESSRVLSFPGVIIPNSGNLDEFYATVATYYGDQTPISALVHVLGEETVEFFLASRERDQPLDRRINGLFLTALVGAAVGESILTGLRAREFSATPSYAACRRTFAFALCRAKILFGTMARPRLVEDRWLELRRLTGLAVPSGSTTAVRLVESLWDEGENLAESHYVEADVWRALTAYVAHGESKSDDLQSAILEAYPKAGKHFEGMKGAFDGRLTTFGRLIDVVTNESRGLATDEIAVAFFCNSILPGSFGHSGILADLAEFFPTALIWYGVLSALSKPSASQRLSSSLIAKLERDLCERFSFRQRPRCDISLEELSVLARGSVRTSVINPSQQRAFLVGLLPGVDIYSRFGTDTELTNERASRDPELAKMHHRVVGLLEDALSVLRRGSDGSDGRDGRDGPSKKSTSFDQKRPKNR